MADPTSEVTRLDELARQHNWISTDDSIQSLDKAGEGNMNRVSRAKLASGTTLILKESLPFVAKFPDIPAPIERIEVEAAFYQAIEGTEVAKLTPRTIGYAPESSCLCLEDLGEGSDLSALYQDKSYVSNDVLSELLGWLGGLHQIPVHEPNQFANLEMRRLNHTHIFALPFQTDNGLEFSQALLEGWLALLNTELTEAAKELGELYLDQNISEGVLLHGDFYPGSWLQTAEGITIIDPEFGFFGPAEFDIGVFYAHLLLAGFTEHEAETTLNFYPQSFEINLAQRFAGIEVLRRLFGVAQLPLTLSDSEKLELAATARKLALA